MGIYFNRIWSANTHLTRRKMLLVRKSEDTEMTQEEMRDVYAFYRGAHADLRFQVYTICSSTLGTTPEPYYRGFHFLCQIFRDRARQVSY